MSGLTDPPAYRLDMAAPAVPIPDVRSGFVAIGSFDGVHRGHQHLIARAAELARQGDARPLTLTFEPHPRAFFWPDEPLFRLTSRETRRTLLGIAGADGIVEAVFNRVLADLGPEEFAQMVLVDRLKVAGVVVGEGFRYGRRRAGTVETLRAAGSTYGFSVDTVQPLVDLSGSVISSGRVRDALAAGDVAAAATLLGYRWFVSGTVIGGDKRGRELGFPTANIVLPVTNGLRYGIYAARVRLPDGHWADAVISHGVRPTFDGIRPLLEAHLFDFSGDLYGKDITVVLLGWIRPELRFDSVDKLIARMEEDSAKARAILDEAGPESRVDQALTESF